MNMLFISLLFVGAVFGIPIKTPCTSETITLGSQWILPLTALDDWQFCTYYFTVPSGSFAFVSFQAFNLNYNQGEAVIFNGDGSPSIYSGSTGPYNWTYAWPSNFSINVQSGTNSRMQVQANIVLQKILVGTNVVQKVNTDVNSPSTVLYTSDLKEGQTYAFNSINNVVNIKATVAYSDTIYGLQNIFVYDSGKLLGTAYLALNRQNMVSSTKSVQLYVAKDVNIPRGAVLVTDNSNMAPLNYHYLQYVPLSRLDHTVTHLLFGDDTHGGALTLIGDKDGSTPFDIRQLNSLDDLGGTFSYVKGGPFVSHTQDIQLDPFALPVHVTGNINTIYISKGEGTVKYTLS